MIFQRSQFSLYIIHSYIQKKCQDSSSHLGESLHTYQSIIAFDHELKIGTRIEQISWNWCNRSDLLQKSILRLLQIAWRFFAIALSANSAPKADNIDRTSDLRRIMTWTLQNQLQIETQISIDIQKHLDKKIHQQFPLKIIWGYSCLRRRFLSDMPNFLRLSWFSNSSVSWPKRERSPHSELSSFLKQLSPSL